MKSSLIRFAAAGLVLVASSASAQVSDHLQCFKIKDSAAKAQYTADLAPGNTAFPDAAGCTIKVPAKWLCLDAAASNVEPERPGAAADGVARTYVCYQAKCPGAAVTAQFIDEFGSHDVSASKSSMVCAPVAPSCTDGIQNGAELGLDCGGPCTPCVGGTACYKDGDCATGICVGGNCVDPAHCTNGVPDADETATDCGGSLCGGCPDGAMCEADNGCLSSVCTASICQPASCSDSHKNQDETSTDCGGSHCRGCAPHAQCNVDGDCALGYCYEGTCSYAFCFNGTKDIYETDTDCGGQCHACPIGDSCLNPQDCQTGSCDSQVCTAPQMCSDAANNCGGLCPPCGPGGACTGPMDCMTGICDSGRCM